MQGLVTWQTSACHQVYRRDEVGLGEMGVEQLVVMFHTKVLS